MRLDSNFYNGMIDVFTSCIDRTFGSDIVKTDSYYKFENRGYFRLEYNYLPSDYKIVIENEMRAFSIRLIDKEQAFNSLYGISKYNNQLTKECIEHAILLLKNVLEGNNFTMYFYKNDKLYKKNADGIKRVKDLKELING